MKKTAKAILSMLGIILVPAAAGAECSYAGGDRVQFSAPEDVAGILRAAAPQKDEFETSAEFELRQTAASAGLANETVLVRTKYDPKYVRYDADRERFLVSEYAWGNVIGSFDKVFGYGNTYSFPQVSISSNNLGQGLMVRERIIGRYEASNAFGKTLTILEIDRIRYGVIDTVLDTFLPDSADAWRLDYPSSGNYLAGNAIHAGVYLPVPISRARELKPMLQFGIEFSPREPFIAYGTDYWAPRADRPTEIHEQIVTFIGDIRCVVIADGEGAVLRIVPPAR